MVRYQVFLIIFFFFFGFVNAQNSEHDFNEIEKNEAERLVRIFDLRFNQILIDSLNSKEEIDSFRKFAQFYIARDRKIFFGKVLHKVITEDGIDEYIKSTLIRIYKNINADFKIYRKSSVENSGKPFKVEGVGDPCNNIDFESANVTGWNGWTGFATTNPYPTNGSLTPGFGIASNQHVVQSGSGFDPIVGGSLLPVVAPGGNYSLRLENLLTGGDLSRISQTFLVNPANINFTYRYAVVLEDPTDSHSDNERPFFRVKVTDGNGNEILCGKYEVIAKPPITGFQQVGSSGYYWRNWTSVSISLAAFVGQNVTIEFTASDCSLGGHLGYAYIDGSCIQGRIEATSTGICNGFPYTLKAPSGYASYSWSGPGISGLSSQAISVSSPGTYICSIVSVSGNNCVTFLKTTVENSASVSAGPDFHICKGGYAQLNGNIALVNSFNWSPTTDMTNPNDLNPIVRPKNTTSYYLSGCGIVDTVTVYIDPVEFEINPKFVLCEPTMVTLTAIPVIPGNYSYSWTPSAGMVGANTFNPSVFVSANSLFNINVTNLNTGCSRSKQDTVIVTSFAKTEVGSTDTICKSSSIQLIAIGGSTFNWTDINGNTPLDLSCLTCANPIASPANTTSYIITSNLNSPCLNKDTMTIVVQNPPMVNLGNDTLICKGENIVYDVFNSGATYLWSTGETTPTIQVFKMGQYWVELNDGICIQRDSVFVDFTNPQNQWYDTVICYGSEMVYKLKDNFKSAIWPDSSVGNSYTVVANDFAGKLVKVQVMDFNNCIYYDSTYLSVKDCTPLFIPNLITPNGDFKNDKFHIKGLPEKSELIIYNRWGDLIYKNKEYDNSWDGEFTDGIYYYKLKLKDGRDFRGWIEVVN